MRTGSLIHGMFMKHFKTLLEMFLQYLPIVLVFVYRVGVQGCLMVHVSVLCLLVCDGQCWCLTGDVGIC